MYHFCCVGFLGGVVTIAGGLLAQVNPDGNAGQAGVWLGLATSAIAGIGGVAKLYFDDRKSVREAEVTREKIRSAAADSGANRREVVATREFCVAMAEYQRVLRRHVLAFPEGPANLPEPPLPPDFSTDFRREGTDG